MEIQHFRFLIPGWRDAIEILLVAVIIYRVLVFLAGTRALQILVGNEVGDLNPRACRAATSRSGRRDEEPH